jgi:hypothetical protein
MHGPERFTSVPPLFQTPPPRPSSETTSTAAAPPKSTAPPATLERELLAMLRDAVEVSRALCDRVETLEEQQRANESRLGRIEDAMEVK